MIHGAFQYSLCRVVLMVHSRDSAQAGSWVLSVLALSSRFDGLFTTRLRACDENLSVLALSSRFDGPTKSVAFTRSECFFQYSLCRVVLMVICSRLYCHTISCFQYSLCRVVLMVIIVVRER